MTPGGHGKNDRTLRYTGGLQPEVPAGITAGPATTSTAPGQIAVLTAVNMLARTHPEIILTLPDAPLLVPSPAGGSALIEACRLLVRAVDPAVLVSTAARPVHGVLSVGIGHDAGPATIYAGGARWTAYTGRQPQPLTNEPSSALGAGLAVTLATGFIFRSGIGLPAAADRGVSLWSLGPATQPTGPAALGPVSVGSTWLVGARLLSERGLAEYYGVAFHTVRHAIKILRERGLIVSVHGRGTFVSDTTGSANPKKN